MLSVKQGSIKYHFLSFSYDSTCDWTQVSRAIGEDYIYIYMKSKCGLKYDSKKKEKKTYNNPNR